MIKTLKLSHNLAMLALVWLAFSKCDDVFRAKLLIQLMLNWYA